MRFATLLALAVSLAAPLRADPVVVELFTSQGCSSCPAADEMLGELAQREDVIALSLHVDYWDFIGWKDTFADPAHSDRQRAYAAAAGSTVVYTPQFVVAGQTHVAGAKGMKLSDAIQAHSTDQDVMSVEAGRLNVAAIGQAARLVVVNVLPEATVNISRGENAGREMTYHHIVQGWQTLAEWDGSDAVFDLPPRDPSGNTVQIILAQGITENGYPGAILGAVRAD